MFHKLKWSKISKFYICFYCQEKKNKNWKTNRFATIPAITNQREAKKKKNQKWDDSSWGKAKTSTLNYYLWFINWFNEGKVYFFFDFIDISKIT